MRKNKERVPVLIVSVMSFALAVIYNYDLSFTTVLSNVKFKFDSPIIYVFVGIVVLIMIFNVLKNGRASMILFACFIVSDCLYYILEHRFTYVCTLIILFVAVVVMGIVVFLMDDMMTVALFVSTLLMVIMHGIVQFPNLYELTNGKVTLVSYILLLILQVLLLNKATKLHDKIA